MKLQFHQLPRGAKTRVCRHFRAAVKARLRQWDHQTAIEEILGYDIDVDIADYAAGCATTESISEQEIEQAIDANALPRISPQPQKGTHGPPKEKADRRRGTSKGDTAVQGSR